MRFNQFHCHLLFLFLFLFLVATARQVEAQRGKSGRSSGSLGVSMILDRLDANKNGILEPAELSDRTKDFIRKSGLDPNRPHSIKSITKMLDEKNKESKQAKSGAGSNDTVANRKVPGFGVPVEKFGVPDFSPSGEERMSNEAMDAKFGESIMAQVDRTLARYDRDKNGLIDKTEQTRTRWTNPSADESDTNQDGNLSRLELAYRYKDRTDKAAKRVASRNKAISENSSSNRRAKPTSSSKGRVSYSSGRGRTTSKRGSNYSSTAASSTSSSKKRFNSGTDAYRRYADGLLKMYDTNKDQKLSQKEMEDMRRKPKNADKNGDGYVDRSELISHVSNPNGGNSEEENKSSIAKNGGSKRSKPRSLNSRDTVFGGKDLNNDGQLQMREFADNWNDRLVEEFKAKDRNGDGVITAKEWAG